MFCPLSIPVDQMRYKRHDFKIGKFTLSIQKSRQDFFACPF